MVVEIRTRDQWTALVRRPSVDESKWFEIRGLPPSSEVRFGNVAISNIGPVARFRLTDYDELRCHIGLLPITVDGEVIGELDVQPGKLTVAAWQALRTELDATWTGLILEDDAPTALEATGPDARELWRRLGPVVANLADNPVRTLATDERWIRRERVRNPSEMTVSVTLAGLRGRPGRARVVAPVVAEPERALVRDCLQRLQSYARRQRSGATVSDAIGRVLARDPFATPSLATVTVTHLARHDDRLRQVIAVRQVLVTARELITEGPGELRLGVRSIDKLYEYWVFLKVVEQLRAVHGEPLGRGFTDLATRLPGRRLRLELAPGTTVEFPGSVYAAYEPRISQSGRESWRDLELVALPAGSRLQTPSFVTPDIVVQRGSSMRSVVVIDAKYRARHSVDEALWDVHRKYGRMRFRGSVSSKASWSLTPTQTSHSIGPANTRFLSYLQARSPTCSGQLTGLLPWRLRQWTAGPLSPAKTRP